jgi:tetratricopeptide (TPR) repeat protein
MRTKTRQNRANRNAVARSSPRSGPSSGTRSGPRWASTALVALLLAGAAIFAYQTSFAGVFVFDDEFAIQRNPNIRTLWPLSRALSAPPESPVSARPVASLTLAVNYALAPLESRDVMAPGGVDAPPDVTRRFLANVWGYHFMNLALHVLAALAAYGVVRRTLVSDRLRPRFGPASGALASAVALVWVVHPLTTDAVTYVTQRTEVLMGLFYLLTLYCAIRGAEPGVDRARRRGWAAAAVVACALGMGSKQTMVTAPFVVLVWDWMFGSPTAEATEASARRLRWRLYAGLAATWAILAAGIALERWPHSIGIDREGWTPWTYLLTQAGVIVHYLRLSFVPMPLVLDYDGWPMARSVLDVAPQAALLGVLVGATIAAVLRRAPWGFAAAWCFALLAPSSSVLPLATEIAAERRMYTALVGVVSLAVIGAYVLGQFLLERLAPDRRPQRTVRAVAILALAGVTGSLAMLTLDRNRDYWSEERIWRDTVEKRPDNPRARLNYGVVLAAERRYPEAEAQLREALRLKEPVAKAHLNLGSILCSQQRFDEGIPHLERAVALDPELSTAQANLGEAYGALGRRAQAAKHFALAVEGEPGKLFLLNRLGWLLATSPEDDVRDAARAVELGERAVRLTSRQDPLSLDTLAAAYAEAGRFDEAAATLREALQLLARRGAADRSMADRLSLYASGRKFRESR